MKKLPFQDVLYYFAAICFSTACQAFPLRKKEVNGCEKFLQPIFLLNWFFHRLELFEARFFSLDALKWWLNGRKQALKLIYYILVLFSTYFTWIYEIGDEMVYCHLYCNIKYYLWSSETYLEPYQKSMMKLLWKWKRAKIAQGWKLLTVVRKEAPSDMFERVLHMPQSCIFFMLHKWNNMMISNSKNLLKGFSRIFCLEQTHLQLSQRYTNLKIHSHSKILFWLQVFATYFAQTHSLRKT